MNNFSQTGLYLIVPGHVKVRSWLDLISRLLVVKSCVQIGYRLSLVKCSDQVIFGSLVLFDQIQLFPVSFNLFSLFWRILVRFTRVWSILFVLGQFFVVFGLVMIDDYVLCCVLTRLTILYRSSYFQATANAGF